MAPKLALSEDEQKALDKEVMVVNVLLWFTPFSFSQKNFFLPTHKGLFQSVSFLWLKDVLAFEAAFFEDDIYILFIYLLQPRIGPN